MCNLRELFDFLGHNKTNVRLINVLLVMLFACFLSMPAKAEYGGGTGEPDDSYLIYNAEQMNEIGADPNDWDKHFKLMADIDLSTYSGTDFNIIGRSGRSAFTGVFDGNNKKISNFTYHSKDSDYTGLFGHLQDSGAKIMNLVLINPNISVGSGTYVGSLVGYSKGTCTNCYVKGGSISGNDQVGGLIGCNYWAEIEDCYSTCDVSGNSCVGGLIGRNLGGKIANSYATGMVSAGGNYAGGLVGENNDPVINCYATGDVIGNDNVGGLVGGNLGPVTNSSATGDVIGNRNVGGLVGNNESHVANCSAAGDVHGSEYVGGLVGMNFDMITNSYSSGNISGDDDVGGLVGNNYSSSLMSPRQFLGRIAYCYSTGKVTGTKDVGGLVGYNRGSEISSSFWDIQTSGLSNMCGRQREGGRTDCDDSKGKTTVEMQTESTFLDAGWDFVSEIVDGTEDFWSICEGMDYPKLASQFLIGDFDGNSGVDLADFAVFAERWLSGDSNFFWCRGADLTNDGNVDFNDLKEFVENWLAEDIGSPAAIGHVIIDDFESYNDLDPNDPESNRIFDIWLDGYFNPAANGSVVGYDNPPYTEQSIVHGGMQSMPYSYNNFFKFSKAELPLSPPQDWTEEGAGVLSLWFRGDKSNAPAPMNVVINGSMPVYHDNPNAVQIDTWTGWTIDLQEFTGVDLTNVNSIAICFGEQNDPQPGGRGKMFFDDIRLYRP